MDEREQKAILNTRSFKPANQSMVYINSRLLVHGFIHIHMCVNLRCMTASAATVVPVVERQQQQKTIHSYAFHIHGN